MARHAGFEGFELIDAPVIDGHPRVLGGSDPAHSPESRTAPARRHSARSSSSVCG